MVIIAVLSKALTSKLPSTIYIQINLVKDILLNEYETDPYFLPNCQIKTKVCLIIHRFYKIYEHEIAFVLICRTARTISGSKLLKNT